MNWSPVIKEIENLTEKIGMDVVGDGKAVTVMGYGPIAKGNALALKARGWVENTDHGSPYYNLQWAGSRKDVNHGLLIGPQAVNYHCGSHLGPRECLTTKVGLASLARGRRGPATARLRASS